MTAALGVTISPVKDLKFDVNWRNTDNLYASLDTYNFSNRTTAERGTLELPNYNLFDLGLSYRINLNNKQQYFTIRGNVYNLLDTTYIAESNTSNHVKSIGDFTTTTTGGVTTTAQQKYDTYINNPANFYKGLDTTNQVFFGFGRTWAATLSFNF